MGRREDLQKRIDKKPFMALNQIVYEQLHEEITNLHLTPGTKINEIQLANELGISRSPIKMAIERLYNEKLIEKTPGKTSRVALVGYEDCMRLCEFRKGLEGTAAFLAASRISKKEISSLKDLLHIQDRAIDEGRIIPQEVDSQFHQIIINASRNQYIKTTYDSLKSIITRYRHYIITCVCETDTYHNKLLEMQKIHFAIIKAMENGYSAIARDQIVNDIDQMRDIGNFLK